MYVIYTRNGNSKVATLQTKSTKLSVLLHQYIDLSGLFKPLEENELLLTMCALLGGPLSA